MFPGFLHPESPSGHTFGRCSGSWPDGRQHSLFAETAGSIPFPWKEGRTEGRKERKEEGRQARGMGKKVYPPNISELGNLHQDFTLKTQGSEIWSADPEGSHL